MTLVLYRLLNPPLPHVTQHNAWVNTLPTVLRNPILLSFKTPLADFETLFLRHLSGAMEYCNQIKNDRVSVILIVLFSV